MDTSMSAVSTAGLAILGVATGASLSVGGVVLWLCQGGRHSGKAFSMAALTAASVYATTWLTLRVMVPFVPAGAVDPLDMLVTGLGLLSLGCGLLGSVHWVLRLWDVVQRGTSGVQR